MTMVLAITFLGILLAVSYIVQRRRATQRVDATSGKKDMGLAPEDFRIPKGIFFHPSHTWVSLMTGGDVRVGIDDFIRNLAGPLKEIDLPDVGAEVAQGTAAVTIKFDSKMLRLPIPISGIVTNINQAIVENPSEIGNRTLAREWLIDITPSKLSDEVRGLNIADQVREWINMEMERIKEFLISQSGRPEMLGATFPDGGEPVQGVLNMLDPEGVQQFEQRFLQA
ncbi:glycine cleavage system protein H [Candidatus Neomarinimicrobiota bacterium]